MENPRWIPDSDEIANHPELSLRARKLLQGLGVRTVGEVRALSDAHLLTSQPVDAAAIAEIRSLFGQSCAVFKGRVHNGQILVDNDLKPLEGASVTIRVEDPLELDAQRLSDELLNLAGSVTDLPPDFSENHDHYLHGHPRR